MPLTGRRRLLLAASPGIAVWLLGGAWGLLDRRLHPLWPITTP